jgi:hypothetical protein
MIKDPNKIKQIICEELININKDFAETDSEHCSISTPFISPTSIDWIGNRLALAIWEYLE